MIIWLRNDYRQYINFQHVYEIFINNKTITINRQFDDHRADEAFRTYETEETAEKELIRLIDMLQPENFLE